MTVNIQNNNDNEITESEPIDSLSSYFQNEENNGLKSDIKQIVNEVNKILRKTSFFY